MTSQELIIFSPAIMFYGFQWYAGAIHAWPTLHVGWRIPTAIGFFFFGGFDVLWNIFAGSVIYLELPFHHHTYTFSQRTQYWYHQPLSWRNTYLLGARNWASLLNSIVKGHIL